jgi:hypothetical protein
MWYAILLGVIPSSDWFDGMRTYTVRHEMLTIFERKNK